MAARIAPRDPLVNFGIKFLKLLLVLGSFTGVKIESFVPASFIEDTLLRIAAEKLLADDRFAVFVFSLDDTDLVEQRHERGVLFHRCGNVMRAPGEGDQSIRAGARRAAGCALELEQDEVGKAGTLQAPRRGETGDAATDDYDRNIGPRIRRHFDMRAIAQTVAKYIGRADNLTRGQSWLFSAPARRERKWHAQKRRKNFTSIHRRHFLAAKRHKKHKSFSFIVLCFSYYLCFLCLF